MQEGTLTFPLFTKADRPDWSEIATNLILLGYIGLGVYQLGFWIGTALLTFAAGIIFSQQFTLRRRIRSGVPAVEISCEGIRMVIDSGEDWRLRWDEIDVLEEQWSSSGNPSLLLCKNTGLHFRRIKVGKDREIYKSLKRSLLSHMQSGTEISLLKQESLYRVPPWLKVVGRAISLVGFAMVLYGFESNGTPPISIGLLLCLIGIALSESPSGFGRFTLKSSGL